MGFSRTRAEARQLVSHKSIVVNGKLVNIASYQVKSGDVVEVREASRSQSRIVEALSIATQAGLADWVDVDEKGLKGTFKAVPTRDQILPDLNEARDAVGNGYGWGKMGG